MKSIVENLLEIKMKTPEIGEIPMIKELNDYFEMNLEELKIRIGNLANESTKDWDELNLMFS